MSAPAEDPIGDMMARRLLQLGAELQLARQSRDTLGVLVREAVAAAAGDPAKRIRLVVAAVVAWSEIEWVAELVRDVEGAESNGF